MTLEDAGQPAQARRDRCSKRFDEYEQAKRELSGGNLRLVVSHRQEVPQPRPVASST